MAAVVTAFAIQGVAAPTRWLQVLITAVLGVSLMLALRVADAQRRVLSAGGAVVLVILAVSLLEALGAAELGNGAMRVANALLVAVGTPAIMLGVVRSIRSQGTVSLQAILGVLSVYIMVGMFFALLYGAIARFSAGSFFAQGSSATVPHCLYFSFTSLTTVGFGDLTARTNLGHTLSVAEALVGQVYLVTIVSLLVANLGRTRPLQRGSHDRDPRSVRAPEGSISGGATDRSDTG